MAQDPGITDPGRIATQQDFGRELTALRERAGLRVREVAKAAGLPHSTAGDYFSGRHLPADGRPEQLLGILRVCGETDPDQVAQWTAALQRARRSPGRRTSTETPYRGLARFERQDARWFFGREDVTALLADLTAEAATEPLVLVGPSGAGKSSLLRAGLLPRLTEPVALFEPTAAPLAVLSAQLAELGGLGNADPENGMKAGSKAVRPTLMVDQFEEVFTLCPDEAERREFISALCELARTALVVLALRADFYDRAIRYPGLASALQARQVVLGPMTAEQVRSAVTEPARLARVDVEEGLVGLLLSDLAPRDAVRPSTRNTAQGAYEPGALPLLSHAMLSSWEHSHGGTLAISDYLASGGIRDAVSRTAERVYGSLSPEEQRLARHLFLRLVHVADDVPPSRATVQLSELRDWGGASDADADVMLARFVDERMITVDADAAQITHDALLTAWPRLRSWIDTGMDGLRTRMRITEGARAWQDAGREKAALWRGSQLAVARDWAVDRGNRASLSTLAAEFVSASVAEDSARELAERRRTRRLQGTVAALTALVVVVCLLAGYAFRQRQEATVAQNDANSREIAIEAGQVRGQDPPLAAQLSVAAYRIARSPQATASLLESTGSPSAARIVDSSGIVQSVSTSPDHKLLAAAGADGTLRLWNVAAPGHAMLISTLLQADSVHPLYTTAFSPDGKILATAGAGQVVKLWNVSNPAHPLPLSTPLTGPTSTVYSIAFSPDGKTIAAGSNDKTVRLWNVSDPARPVPLGRPLTGPAAAVQSVAFAPGGTVLAAGSADKTVRLWNVASLSRPVPLPGGPLTGPASMVTGVAFSPRDNLLAAASQDDKVWLWKMGAGKPVPDGTLAGATNWVNTVAFSPDGAALAAGTSEARVLVWSMATRSLTAALPQPQPVTTVTWDGTGLLAAADADGTASIWTLPTPVLPTDNASASVAYSPDGKTLAVGGRNIELWNASSRELTATRPLPGGMSVNGLAYSPDGKILAAAYADSRVQLLAGKTLEPLGPAFRASARDNAESVAFSPDGKTLATGGDDGTVRLWSLADPARPRQLASVPDSGTYVYTVVFAPDGKTLAAASIDNLTRLWNITDPAHPATIGKPLAGLASYAIGLAFTPDSRLLAVGSADGSVRLWNVSNPAHPVLAGAPLTGPTGYVWAVAFSPDGKTLAAGVTDHTVWLWNVADPTHPSLIATLTGPSDHVYSVAFSPNGGELAATSYDGTVHLWDTRPETAHAAVCADLGQPLTPEEWAANIPGVPYHRPCS
jgi:WD40 repeat protein/transcriptional regulator with XRE-family HTH domain